MRWPAAGRGAAVRHHLRVAFSATDQFIKGRLRRDGRSMSHRLDRDHVVGGEAGWSTTPRPVFEALAGHFRGHGAICWWSGATCRAAI